MVSAYHQLYYHFIWGTFERQKMIDERIEKVLKKLIKDKVNEKKSELICFGCTDDHVHLLVRLHPALSISEIIGEIKGYSSYVIANQIHLERDFRWQGGYGALSVSRKDISRLIGYIENQKEHHNNDNLNKNWELFES